MENLVQRSNEMRADIVAMICRAGSGHPGGSLSCIDILTALYFGGVMSHNPNNPDDDLRDRFILAKGHAAPALYVALAHAGYFPKDELSTLRQVGSRLQGHPDSNLLPGVEVSTGSLGQGLSIAAGIACGIRLAGSNSSVFALLGDGECEEGQVWEAAMFAAKENLYNLIAIVDANGLQIDGAVDNVAGLGNIGAKFEAFGWKTLNVDGHNLDALVATLNQARDDKESGPIAIIANTIKGKGVSFMEDKAGWHGKAPSSDETICALDEIGCMCGSALSVEKGGN